jgi:hypothetical protein
MSSNNCSAQNRPKELKLVSLELPVNEDMSSRIFMSVNELANQNIWQHYLPKSGGGGAVCVGQFGPQEVVEIAIL